jgi:hypothetical protein
MPKVGAVIKMGKTSVWAPCKVTRVTGNFAHTNEEQRVGGKKAKSAVMLRPGMLVDLRLPPLDDRATTLLILTVGIIYAKSHKYRAAIFRRKSTSATWGPLETLNIAGFPDQDHCSVSDTDLTHNNATRTHTRLPRISTTMP